MPVLNKEDKNEVLRYNEFVQNFNGASLMQDLGWGEVKNNWKKEGIYIEENGKICATMMVLFEKIPKINAYMMYAPRGPVCDIYNIELVKKLVEEANKLAKINKAFVLKIDPQVVYDDKLAKIYMDAGFRVSPKDADIDSLIQPIQNVVLNIKNKTEEELLKGFMEKTRYNIRLSNRKGISVNYSHDIKDLEIFYEIYKITTIRDKIGCRSFEYFERMLNAYDEKHLRIYIAKHENTNLSAAIALNFGGELFYLYGASSNEKRNLMPNYAMQWEMIKWGIDTKCCTYNFGGLLTLDKDNGLYKFKTGFCTVNGIEKYIGEIDKIYNKAIYLLYSKGLPIYKKVGRKLKGMKTH
ncbi:MAG: peptidoglycan bridge formation glycyltransferase FemA/FemB family protein [Clostridia bacterium]